MSKLYFIFLVVLLPVSFLVNSYQGLAILITAMAFVRFLNNFGKGIVILDIVSLNVCILYLLMPILGYNFFPKSNPLSAMWVKFMFVEEKVYFGYIIPAVICYFIGLNWYNRKREELNEQGAINKLLERMRAYDNDSNKAGILLSLIGFTVYVVTTLLDISGGLVGFYAYLVLYPGFLYIFFNKRLKFRWLYIALIILFLLYDSVSRGVFTVFVYMGATITSLIFIGRRIKLASKVGFTVLAGIFLIVIQNAKLGLRKRTWFDKYQTESAGDIFKQEVAKSLGEIDNIFDPKAFFPIYVRMNQGQYISIIQYRIPSKQPYSGGGPILKVLASSFVPRILWPDKPKSGGQFNMKHYANITLRGWAADVGPFGEAYGNFGPKLACIYMFLLGFLINWFFFKILKIAQKIPAMIFWIPLFFYTITYSGENDTLAVVNWITKSSLFVYLLYRLFPNLFMVKYFR